MTANLRILALSDKVHGGGSVMRYKMLLKGFVSSGHEVYHLAPAPIGDLLQFDNYNWLKVYKVPIPPRVLTFSSFAFIAAARLMQRIPINAAVVFNSVHAIPIIVLKNMLRNDVKVILSPRSDILITTRTRFGFCRALQMAIGPYVALLKKLEGYALRNADLVIFQSIFDRETYCCRHRISSSNSKFKVIYNAIERTWLRDSEQKIIEKGKMDEWVIGYVGRLSRIKGVNYLVKAFAKLSSDVSNVRLIIIGDGPERNKVMRLAKKLKCDHRIKLIGWSEDVMEHMLRIDVLVVPSVYDWTPNVVLEGLACERVVIGSRVGGIVEQLKFEDLMFEPEDSDGLALKLKQIVTDIHYYDYLRQLCITRRREFVFDWAGKIISAVEEICKAQS